MTESFLSIYVTLGSYNVRKAQDMHVPSNIFTQDLTTCNMNQHYIRTNKYGSVGCVSMTLRKVALQETKRETQSMTCFLGASKSTRKQGPELIYVAFVSLQVFLNSSFWLVWIWI